MIYLQRKLLKLHFFSSYFSAGWRRIRSRNEFCDCGIEKHCAHAGTSGLLFAQFTSRNLVRFHRNPEEIRAEFTGLR